jgi:sporulation protein YlmC with PRC-barrel domain
MATATGHTSAIRAKKVIGTNVKDTSGRKIGEIEDVVLDKQSNSIMFAVVGFGGFLGMAEKYHPIPWASLDYQPAENSYVVNYTKEQLQAAPAGSIEELTRDDGVSFRDRAYDYYKAPRYWDAAARPGGARPRRPYGRGNNYCGRVVSLAVASGLESDPEP